MAVTVDNELKADEARALAGKRGTPHGVPIDTEHEREVARRISGNLEDIRRAAERGETQDKTCMSQLRSGSVDLGKLKEIIPLSSIGPAMTMHVPLDKRGVDYYFSNNPIRKDVFQGLIDRGYRLELKVRTRTSFGLTAEDLEACYITRWGEED